MPSEPSIKRAVVFIDGQNLFHAAREAFGYTYPNYDVGALIAKTDWIQVERPAYDACLDRRDHRPKSSREE